MIVDVLLFGMNEFNSFFEAEEYAKEYVQYNFEFTFED
jgi:hypothetical protein